MSEATATPPAADATPPAKPRRGKALIFIILALVVLGGAGGGGFWWWRRSQAQAAAPQPEKTHPATGIIAMEPFLVNLADREASRFLRVTLRLVVDEESEAKEIEENAVMVTRMRSAILELLATQDSAVLVTPEGKTALKHAIAEKAGAVLTQEVRDVLFTDFVVQF